MSDLKLKKMLLSHAKNKDLFFDILFRNVVHCNWINIRILELTASSCSSLKLQCLIEQYKATVFPKTLQKVGDSLLNMEIQNRYYDELRIIFKDKNFSNTKVEDLIKKCLPPLTKNVEILIKTVHQHSLDLKWLIPAHKEYQCFLNTLALPQELRHYEFLQIGSWVVYHPHHVLQELKADIQLGQFVVHMFYVFLLLVYVIFVAMVSTSTLIVGYYHGLLLRDINTDFLLDDLCSEGLLSSHDCHLISTGYSVYQKNWLLLEHVRHMDKQRLLAFCKLVLSLWPEIGSQLHTGM